MAWHAVGGGKYKCFGLAETFIASLAVVASFPSRIYKLLYNVMNYTNIILHRLLPRMYENILHRITIRQLVTNISNVFRVSIIVGCIDDGVGIILILVYKRKCPSSL